ncbi:epithelial membrane protein 1 [Biomphalaria glabrata]|nr:epithelial membrane protein 1 [Biomphalaria glabrata]
MYNINVSIFLIESQTKQIMGIKDSFMAANLAMKLVFFIILLANVVNWIAFCTTSWHVSFFNYTGLWRYNTSPLDGTPDDEYIAIQAFSIFGFISLNVGFGLIVLYMFWGSCQGNSETNLAAAITLFVSAGSWLIAVAIFGAKFEGTERFGYSFALAVCALILGLIGGIILIIGGRGNSSVSSK